MWINGQKQMRKNKNFLRFKNTEKKEEKNKHAKFASKNRTEMNENRKYRRKKTKEKEAICKIHAEIVCIEVRLLTTLLSAADSECRASGECGNGGSGGTCEFEE